MSSSRSTVDRIEYFNVALPTLEEVEQVHEIYNLIFVFEENNKFKKGQKIKKS